MVLQNLNLYLKEKQSTPDWSKIFCSRREEIMRFLRYPVWIYTCGPYVITCPPPPTHTHIHVWRLTNKYRYRYTRVRLYVCVAKPTRHKPRPAFVSHIFSILNAQSQILNLNMRRSHYETNKSPSPTTIAFSAKCKI